MEFCDSCQNLMYPYSRGGHLIYFCRACAQASTTVSTPCVFKHKFVNTENVDSKMPNRNIILDPTLPRDRTLECSCGQGDPVYFQPSEESMQLIYACRNPVCGKMGKLGDFKVKMKAEQQPKIKSEMNVKQEIKSELP